jgi:hypothetical protein
MKTVKKKTSTLIINSIVNNKTLTLSDLEARALKRGLSLDNLYNALEQVAKDRRVKRTVKGDEIVYTYQPPKPKSPTPGTDWIRVNYPWPGKDGVPEFVMPWPEWSLKWMFLTPAEMKEYRAMMKGSWQAVKTPYNKRS